MSEIKVGIYDHDYAHRPLSSLIDRLRREVIFGVSDLNWDFDPDDAPEMAAALDILATLCEYWQHVTWISEQEVNEWREAYLTRVKHEWESMKQKWDVTFPLDSREEERVKVIVATFDRLETAVRANRNRIGNTGDGIVGDRQL
jgi:hypothetical protein